MKDLLISLVLPLRGQSPELLAYLRECHKILSQSFSHFEIIVLSFEKEVFENLQGSEIIRLDGIRLVLFSQNSDLDVIISSGLDLAIGDVSVVAIPGSDKPQLIPDLVDVCLNENAVVIGTRKSKRTGSFFEKTFRGVFLFLANRVFLLHLPPNTTYLLALNRKAISQLKAYKHKFRFLKILFSSVGLKTVFFPYEPEANVDFFNSSLWEKTNLSLDLLFNSSVRPLRWVTFFLFGLGTLFLSTFLFNLIFSNTLTEVSTILVLLSFGLCFSLAIFGEYIRRMIEQTSISPNHIVLEDKSQANAISSGQKRNVVSA